MKRALISVADKTGVVFFAQALVELGYEIVASGGTAQHLREQGLALTEVAELTKFPELMGGRLKTLHPLVHGGILMRRDRPSEVWSASEQGIHPFSIVAVNFYPFRQTIGDKHILEDAIENIDIGGPAMVRSAAKNHLFVAAVTNPRQYEVVLRDLREQGEVTLATRKQLAVAAFQYTAYYDSLVSQYLGRALGQEEFPPELGLPLHLVMTLRYGENPHQSGALYSASDRSGGLCGATQLQGKELSYCNIADADAASALVHEFASPAVVVVKHASPCGVAVAPTIDEACRKALECDQISVFGGIVALNREVDEVTATALSHIFLEVCVAPAYSSAARQILSAKKNLRLLTVAAGAELAQAQPWEIKSIAGGYLVQSPDVWGSKALWQVVTAQAPTPEQSADLEFAFIVAKHVKSNAIVIAKGGATVGIGTGQGNRIDAARQAIARAGARVQGAVLASDAFFPQPDVLEECAKAGVVAVIQPGGSVKDDDSLAVANAHCIAMVHTKERHFKH